MKICPNCKKQYADNAAVCPDDGTFLDLETPAIDTQTYESAADTVPHTADSVDRIGTAAAETFDRDAGAFGAGMEPLGDRAATTTAFSETGDLAGDDYSENPLFGWLVPLIIVAVLLVLGFMFCSKPVVPTAKADEIWMNCAKDKLI
ncbi:MAG TPA: hypothetical protein VGB68_04490 [Pyrinomonadaceae bacterium]|jgi:hypothetical protein